jgi:hypothetical protein
MSAGATRAEAEVLGALARHGARAPRLTPISAFPGVKGGGRHAFRVDAGGGAILKARHMGREEDARDLQRLREGLEPAFVPVLAREGAILIEPWVPGTAPVDNGEPIAERAGALLGRLHTFPAGPERRASTSGYLEAARADLAILRDLGGLAPAETVEIEGLLSSLDPGEHRVALIHRDFCLENFVLDPGGNLHVIDNEWFELGAPGFDLGRSLHRWPMGRAAWERFLRGYETGSDLPEALEFWALAATVFGARVYGRHAPPRAEPLLEMLGAAAAGRELTGYGP